MSIAIENLVRIADTGRVTSLHEPKFWCRLGGCNAVAAHVQPERKVDASSACATVEISIG